MTRLPHQAWAQLRIQPKELIKLMACKFLKQSSLCSWEEQSWSVRFLPADSFKGKYCDNIFRKNAKYQDKMGAVKCHLFFDHHRKTRTWFLKSFTLLHLRDGHRHTSKIEKIKLLDFVGSLFFLTDRKSLAAQNKTSHIEVKWEDGSC